MKPNPLSLFCFCKQMCFVSKSEQIENKFASDLFRFVPSTHRRHDALHDVFHVVVGDVRP